MTELATAPPGAAQSSAASRLRPREMHESAQQLEVEFGFADFLDIVNPLQHIPVVSAIYREITGDQIGTPARVVGGGLFGGPLGIAGAVANAVVEEVTGADIAGNLVELFDTAPDDAALATAPGNSPGTDSAAQLSAAQSTVGEGPAAVPPLQVPPPAVPRQPVEVVPLDRPAGDGDTAPPPSVAAAAAHPRNQIPQELLEALYQMHRDQAAAQTLDHRA